jgi:hypothetical protein
VTFVAGDLLHFVAGAQYRGGPSALVLCRLMTNSNFVDSAPSALSARRAHHGGRGMTTSQYQRPSSLEARANASAQPSTRTIPLMPMVQRAANTGRAPSSARPHPAGLWRRSAPRPSDFQRAVTIPRIQSSPRSSKTDGKYPPRPHHRPAA